MLVIPPHQKNKVSKIPDLQEGGGACLSGVLLLLQSSEDENLS